MRYNALFLIYLSAVCATVPASGLALPSQPAIVWQRFTHTKIVQWIKKHRVACCGVLATAAILGRGIRYRLNTPKVCVAQQPPQPTTPTTTLRALKEENAVRLQTHDTHGTTPVAATYTATPHTVPASLTPLGH